MQSKGQACNIRNLEGSQQFSGAISRRIKPLDPLSALLLSLTLTFSVSPFSSITPFSFDRLRIEMRGGFAVQIFSPFADAACVPISSRHGLPGRSNRTQHFDSLTFFLQIYHSVVLPLHLLLYMLFYIFGSRFLHLSLPGFTVHA